MEEVQISEKKKSKRVKENEIRLSVACGIRYEGIPLFITTYEGLKSDCINFMNKAYSEKYLETGFKGEVIFNIAYANNEELNNPNNWFTLDELKQAGILEVSE